MRAGPSQIQGPRRRTVLAAAESPPLTLTVNIRTVNMFGALLRKLADCKLEYSIIRVHVPPITVTKVTAQFVCGRTTHRVTWTAVKIQDKYVPKISLFSAQLVLSISSHTGTG